MLIFQRRRCSRSRAAAARDYIGAFTIEARPSPEFKARSHVEHPKYIQIRIPECEVDLLGDDSISSLRPFVSSPRLHPNPQNGISSKERTRE